ncbi:hypothetical protein [Streptomyces misionensis]
MTRPIAAMDVPLSVVEAEAALQQLLAAPPAGHTPDPQPDDWYEDVFDAMAGAHPEKCTRGEEEL